METRKTQIPITDTKRCLTVKEFRHRYSWGHTKAHEFIATGRLKSFKLGGKRLIRIEDAEAFLVEASQQ